MDRVRALKQLFLNFCFSLFYFTRVSRYCLLVYAWDKTDRIQAVLAKLIDMPDCVPRSHENSKKNLEKGTRTREAVAQHVDWLVQKCDYLYIETRDVNRIYLQFVRHPHIEIVGRHISAQKTFYIIGLQWMVKKTCAYIDRIFKAWKRQHLR